MTDGTLTLLLGHFAGERIIVDRLAQHVISGTAAPQGPLPPAKGPVLVRDVDLAGEHSARTYVRARSITRLEAIPTAMGEELLTSRTPLGVLLNKYGLGVFRRPLGIHEGSPLDEGEVSWTSRSSLLSVGRSPAISLVEAFPDNVLLDLDAAVRDTRGGDIQ